MITVIGSNGLAGNACIQYLHGKTKELRGVNRHVFKKNLDGVEQATADIFDPVALRKALQGSEVVVLCARPEYWEWTTKLLPLVKSVVHACQEVGARLLFMDNLYAYGKPNQPLTETSPMLPHGPKGLARKQLSEYLMDLHEKGIIEVGIARAADFWGPGVTYPPLSTLFQAIANHKNTFFPSSPHVAHSISYLPDVGRGLAKLALSKQSFGQIWHLPVQTFSSEAEFLESILTVTQSKIKVRGLNPILFKSIVHVGGIFSKMMRELPEIFYQHDFPFVVDDSKFKRLFNDSSTPIEKAIEETLRWHLSPTLLSTLEPLHWEGF